MLRSHKSVNTRVGVATHYTLCVEGDWRKSGDVELCALLCTMWGNVHVLERFPSVCFFWVWKTSWCGCTPYSLHSDEINVRTEPEYFHWKGQRERVNVTSLKPDCLPWRCTSDESFSCSPPSFPPMCVKDIFSSLQNLSLLISSPLIPYAPPGNPLAAQRHSMQQGPQCSPSCLCMALVPVSVVHGGCTVPLQAAPVPGLQTDKSPRGKYSGRIFCRGLGF